MIAEVQCRLILPDVISARYPTMLRSGVRLSSNGVYDGREQTSEFLNGTRQDYGPGVAQGHGTVVLN